MIDLNRFESALSRVMPAWGLRRLVSKMALEESRVLARKFDAARLDRRTEGWRATGGSANAELVPALATVIKRSRDMCRNNEWAANGKRKSVAHMIGTGITPRPKKGTAKKAKAAAASAWSAFSDNCDPDGRTDFYGKQAQVAGEVFEGGAAFVRWHVRPPSFGLTVPLQCEVLEHEFLDTQKTEVFDRDGNVVVHGVEYDSFGRRGAYWLFPYHPGEISIIRRNSFKSERVPVEEVDHIFRVDRAGQVTGVPWLAPCMLRMRDAADYEEAELVRKKIEACLAVFVKRSGMGPTTIAQSVDGKTDAKGRRLERISPGLIAYLQEGEEIQTAMTTTSAGYAEHMERQLYAFAAGIGLTFSQASGNVSKANYSSQREGKLDQWPVLDQLQHFMLVPQLCRPAWRRVMRASAARGLQVSADLAAEYTPPRRPWVDPLKDVQAIAYELALGLEDWDELVAARGYDPGEMADKVLAWMKKFGIKPGAVPGGASAQPGKSGKETEEEDDDADDDDAE